MPNPQRLLLLTELRKAAGLSLSDMAHSCGLAGNQSHQTAGAWERGDYVPAERRRIRFLSYLWHKLRLRPDQARLTSVWNILVDEWQWAPLTAEDWQALEVKEAGEGPTGNGQRSTPVAFRSELKTAPFQAPALTPHFVGREAEFAQLESLFASGEQPMVALVGMGGIGKTTLAISLAHQLRSYFGDGILWAPMASAEPQDILQSWAQAFGYDLSTIGNVESKAAALRSMLTGHSLLMVLDDIRDVKVARLLLPNSPTCAVLMTTRDHDIARLLNAHLFSLEQLAVADSLALLEQLIGAGRVAAEQSTALMICHLVEQFPLALEIIGKLLARMPWRSLTLMEQHLRDVTQRLDQLQLKDLSVRASFEVSWEMLDDALRELFSQLGVWRGSSFAVTAIAQVTGLTLLVAEEGLSTLVALSLLSSETPLRYRQHPLLADFAYERLHHPEAAKLNMANYYLTVCSAQPQDHLCLEQEAENIMASMQNLRELHQWAAVVAFAEHLMEHWVTRAHYSYARRGHAWALEALQTLAQIEQTPRHWIAWGYACAEQGDFAEAETHIRAGLAAAQRTGDPSRTADAQYHLGRLAIERSEHEAADEYLTQCEALRRQTGDQRGLARVVHLRAMLLYRLGNYPASHQLCEVALTIQEEFQDHAGLLSTLSLLTDNALMQRDHQQAERYCQRSVQCATQYNYQSELAEAYFHYAAVCHRLEQFDKAWDYAEQARQHFERMGNRAWLAHVLYELSMIKRIVGDNSTAITLGAESLQLMTELQDEYNRVMCLVHLGELYRRIGDSAEARRLWQTAEALALQIRHPDLPEIQTTLLTL